MPGRQIVEHDHGMPGLGQAFAHVRAYVTGPTCHQHIHRALFLIALAVRRERIERGRGIETDVRKLQLRSEEHTSELQSLMRNSYAVFCLKQKKNTTLNQQQSHLPYNKKLTHTSISSKNIDIQTTLVEHK